MNAHIIRPDGTVEVLHETPDNAKLRALVGGFPEHVSVLFNDKRASMYVNEEGAIMEPPQRINPWATAIYWAYDISRGKVPDHSWPWIHGVAVLCEEGR